jgi:hypothetical protein
VQFLPNVTIKKQQDNGLVRLRYRVVKPQYGTEIDKAAELHERKNPAANPRPFYGVRAM